MGWATLVLMTYLAKRESTIPASTLWHVCARKGLQRNKKKQKAQRK